MGWSDQQRGKLGANESLSEDTDGDGWADEVEVHEGTNPGIRNPIPRSWFWLFPVFPGNPGSIEVLANTPA